VLVDVVDKSLAAGAARGPLSHAGWRAVKAAERKRVDLAEQIGGGPRRELPA
jgi:hypothetical protein